MNKSIKIVLGAALAVAAYPLAALADRAPTSAERARIADVLQANGFTSWQKIELDDGKWEVDNARHANGKLYDVDLARNSLNIIKRELE
jgi:hypothetical protein